MKEEGRGERRGGGGGREKLLLARLRVRLPSTLFYLFCPHFSHVHRSHNEFPHLCKELRVYVSTCIIMCMNMIVSCMFVCTHIAFVYMYVMTMYSVVRIPSVSNCA